MADIPLNFMGEDFIAVVDYRVTSWGCPAQLYGPPENCYPAEPPEWEIDSIVLRWDRVGGLGPEFEATGELFDHMNNLDKINDAICEAICSDGPPEPEYDYDYDHRF
jgi:hypothetical protein